MRKNKNWDSNLGIGRGCSCGFKKILRNFGMFAICKWKKIKLQRKPIKENWARPCWRKPHHECKTRFLDHLHQQEAHWKLQRDQPISARRSSRKYHLEWRLNRCCPNQYFLVPSEKLQKEIIRNGKLKGKDSEKNCVNIMVMVERIKNVLFFERNLWD